MNYQITTLQGVGIAILVLWDLIWKAVAVWRAATRRQVGWYIVLLLVNSAGILPIAYLLLTRGASSKQE